MLSRTGSRPGDGQQQQAGAWSRIGWVPGTTPIPWSLHPRRVARSHAGGDGPEQVPPLIPVGDSGNPVVEKRISSDRLWGIGGTSWNTAFAIDKTYTSYRINLQSASTSTGTFPVTTLLHIGRRGMPMACGRLGNSSWARRQRRQQPRGHQFRDHPKAVRSSIRSGQSTPSRWSHACCAARAWNPSTLWSIRFPCASKP